jgi:hypothetical protein
LLKTVRLRPAAAFIERLGNDPYGVISAQLQEPIKIDDLNKETAEHVRHEIFLARRRLGAR